MKRVFSATCLALVCAVGLSAQTPPQAQGAADGQKGKSKESAASDRSVTLTGCLRAGETPNSYVLANVTTDATAPKKEEPTSPANPDQPTAPPSSPTQPPVPSTPPSAPPSPTQPPANPGNPPVTPTTPPTAPNPPSNPDAGAPVGTSGTEPASSDVRLIGAPAGADLKAHVGHTVKVTGMWVPQAAAKTGEAKSLNVKSFSHVSDTCK
jgi:hypothetical protein